MDDGFSCCILACQSKSSYDQTVVVLQHFSSFWVSQDMLIKRYSRNPPRNTLTTIKASLTLFLLFLPFLADTQTVTMCHCIEAIPTYTTYIWRFMVENVSKASTVNIVFRCESNNIQKMGMCLSGAAI